MSKFAQKLWGIGFTLLGLAFMAYLLHKLGIAEIQKAFQELGWRLSYIFVLPLVWYISHTMGWYLTIEETGRHVSFLRLLCIKLGGETINTITPLNFMGGDPWRIYALRREMPVTLSTASTVLDRTMQSLAVVLLVLWGLVSASFHLNLPRAWSISFPILVGVMLVLVWFAIHRQRNGVFGFLSRNLTRLGFTRHHTESLQKNIIELDERISRFYQYHRGRFCSVLFFHFFSRFLGIVEIYLIAFFLSIPLSFDGALYLGTLSVLVNMVFVFIPGSMGVLEGAYGALFHLMSLNPALGVALQLIRRVRTTFWILVGLVFVIPYGMVKGKK